MNPEIIYTFEKFLENKGYSPQTIHTYMKALEQAPDSWNVTDSQLLYEHINRTLTNMVLCQEKVQVKNDFFQ